MLCFGGYAWFLQDRLDYLILFSLKTRSLKKTENKNLIPLKTSESSSRGLPVEPVKENSPNENLLGPGAPIFHNLTRQMDHFTYQWDLFHIWE